MLGDSLIEFRCYGKVWTLSLLHYDGRRFLVKLVHKLIKEQDLALSKKSAWTQNAVITNLCTLTPQISITLQQFIFRPLSLRPYFPCYPYISVN